MPSISLTPCCMSNLNLRIGSYDVAIANDEFLRMTGFTHEDVLAGRVRSDEITSSDLRDRNVSALQGLLEKGKNTADEKALISKDERRVPVIVGAALLENEPERVNELSIG